MAISNNRSERFAGRRLVVTGGGSGIGRAVAEGAAAEGAKVAVLDINLAGAEETAGRIAGSAHQVDVSDAASVEAAIAAAARAMGGIDGLVNTAGIVGTTLLPDLDIAYWNRMIGINLTGPYLTARACLPHLQAAPGVSTIVNVASAQVFRPGGAACSYAASKAGVVGLTRILSVELAPHIRVNCVSPGITDTPMAAAAKAASGGTGALPNAKDYVLGRMAAPAEIASAILYLSSSDASYVTGIVLSADGGRSFH